ncbi:SufE protein 1 [Spatholobus suberectus]|nr:SufE protein 1 [Spatholobus suberectus]
MATNSISSSSFRLVTTRIPLSLFRQTPTLLPTPTSPLFPFKPITFQRLPPTPSSSSSPSPSTSLQPVEDLPPKLQEIVHLFQSVPEPKAKYEQLLFYGKNLIPLDSRFKTNDNKVQGCVSQVWVRAYLDPNRNVVYEADSDSVLTKGLAALLVQGLSGRPVNEIIRVTPDFVTLLGLQQSLTPRGTTEEGAYAIRGSRKGRGRWRNGDSETASRGDYVELGGRGKRIRERLERELEPVELEVEDVSYQHAGHAGVRGGDGETHFNVKVVSREFEGKSLVKRHRLVYGLLREELESGLHALSIVAKTPAEVGEG